MEGFPVRVIGNILSHFADVQDVVRASWTCRKWRAAFRHLHTLRHEYVEVFHFWEIGDEEQELEQKHECLLTDTILQTSGLQNLSIVHSVSFSATAVVAWLLHTGDSLCHLTYHVPKSTPYVNLLERCSRMKCLKSLDFSQTGIRFTKAGPIAERFLCLLSLRMFSVEASALQIQSLVSTCQKLESLSLECITFLDTKLTLSLTSSSLKSFFLKGMSRGDVILEAKRLESLRLLDSKLSSFKLVKKSARLWSLSTVKLRSLTIDDVELEHFDLGDSTCDLNFEELELRASGLAVCIAIDRVLSIPSMQLRRLQLMDIPLAVDLMNMRLERIAFFYPRLYYLGLSYTLLPGQYDLSYPTPKEFCGSTVLGKVRTLELEGPKLDGSFLVLMGEALKRCPNVTRLIVRIDEGEAEIKGAYDVTRFIQLVRQYERVVIEFRNRHDRITGS
ncbi:unnamed protein product [Sphagnum balticum]